MYPLISLEDHFLSSTLDDDEGVKKTSSLFPAETKDKLLDIGPLRLNDMDAGGLRLQVLSHFCYDGSAARCRAINDDVFEQITRANAPDRFAAFATLSMSDPNAAAKELRRCVTELHFTGALIDNHLHDGTFYDDVRFWPVFDEAEKLDVPIYLHPSFASEEEHQRHAGNYGAKTQMMLGMAGWNWHSECALHFLRLFAAGLFDRFPKLKLVLGHMGELLPFQLERVKAVAARGAFGERQRSLDEVWDGNVWLTTSGMFSLNPMACLLRNTRHDRIMYSVDYPFSSNKTGLEFMQELEKSDLVTDEELASIAYKNAMSLLKVQLPEQTEH